MTPQDTAHAPAAQHAAAASELKTAAVLNDGSADVDALLADVAHRLQAQGRRVRGLLMTWPEPGEGCARAMVMVDLASGDEYLVSQPLGADSRACRADPQGFARASQVLRQALADSPDLVILNRFGSLEAEGGGFRAELLDLLAHGVPVLTAVALKHRQAWQAFIGGTSELPPDRAAVDHWLAQCLPGAAPAATA